jgi:hypothetical protein
MRRTLWHCLLLLLTATSAQAQVQVDVHLDKVRYLAGEPVVVVVDVRNVGDEAVEYSSCEWCVQLAVTGVERRVRPNIVGCFGGMSGGVQGGGFSHPPLLPPGQTTSFRYLLKEYDLRPGQYDLTASGKAGVRWTSPTTDPVPGAQFDRTLTLNIAASTDDALKDAFAPLVSDADAADPVRRYRSRAAIVESAPPFLETLIARFVTEDQFSQAAIDALGRIASSGSRMHLKNLLGGSPGASRTTIVLALARIGHQDDRDFLVSVLRDETADPTSRGYAALGLGRIGGDQAVRDLERAVPAAPPDVRASIVTALGNTRSGAAVPVLIGMFEKNPPPNGLCGALQTLTHRAWCDGTASDSSAQRRRWLRWWGENGASTSIFGSDNCQADPVSPAVVLPAAPALERSRATGPPRITSIRPSAAAPNSIVTMSGYALGFEKMDLVHLLFTRGNVERVAAVGGGGRAISRDRDRDIHYAQVVIPAALTPGRWQVVVDVNGRRSVPVAMRIIEVRDVELTGIFPQRPHPEQAVFVVAKTPAQAGDYVQLMDARGTQWHIETGISVFGLNFTLPDEVADGEASLRVGRHRNGVDRLSAARRFVVTSGPLPLKSEAVAFMKPVAPGQWTDLARDLEIGFEIGRADRIDVEFRQGRVVVISQATGPDGVHVQVPARLAPGSVSVRTRTWIEQTASEWSAPGEVSSYYSSEREPRGRESWFDVLGGIRQRLVQRPRVTVFAQFLIGGTRYTQRFSRPANFSNSLVWVVLKPGLGVNMPLSSRWSVRLRTDVRLAAKGGEATGAWILGSGIVGRLGRP